MNREAVAAARALFCCIVYMAAGCVSPRIKPDAIDTKQPAPQFSQEQAPNTIDPSKTSVEISIREQKLFLSHNGVIVRVYGVSTAVRGAGNTMRSKQTPLGLHRIYKKIGHGEPIGKVFRWATPQNYIVSIWETVPVRNTPRYITTRILWLEGMKDGHNKGKEIDSKKRHIYIHGTNQEGAIGTPDSIGCILMRNEDIIELFNLVREGTIVNIVLSH